VSRGVKHFVINLLVTPNNLSVYSLTILFLSFVDTPESDFDLVKIKLSHWKVHYICIPMRAH